MICACNYKRVSRGCVKTYISDATVESASNAGVVVQDDGVVHTTHEDRSVQVQIL